MAFAGGAEAGGVLSSASDGASAIACMGSGSGPAMKTAMPLAPAISPNATKADTRPSLRNSLGAEPIYPNSGCRSRAKGTAVSSAPPTPSRYIAANKQLGKARCATAGRALRDPTQAPFLPQGDL